MKNHASLNHAYRLVWSEVLNAYVAVSEHTKSRGKSSSAKKLLLATLLSSLGLSSINAMAGPDGGQITSGVGSISQTGNTTTIHQTSQTLNANWQSFNVNKNETVNFVQPNSTALAVNRIYDTNGSKILGNINANGQVWLINPNGVFFGQGSQVNVGSLLATTLNPLNTDLNTNSTQVFGNGGTGSIINQGTINTSNGGYVALIANKVTNTGSIQANGGTVAMGAGSQVSVKFADNQLLFLNVDQSTLNNIADNQGIIQANGGQVLLSAGAKDSLLASVVNNTGKIEAKTVQHKDGKIILLAGMHAGITHVDGTLDASASTADNNNLTANGGFIETSAAHVKVADSANVTTKAQNGETGTWLIDPVDFTVAASGGDMTGTAVNNALVSNDFQIQSTSGASGVNGDININDQISWSTDNTLTLTAQRNININNTISATGANGKLALEYGQANAAAGNTATYNVNAKVNLQAGDNFSTKLGSDGTTTQYKVITTLGSAGSTTGTDLQGINGNLTGNYVLGADIEAYETNSTWNNSAGFDPLGKYNQAFSGKFDGLGHTISNLFISRPFNTYVGLFGYTDGAIIRNIGSVNGNINGYGAGGLIGSAIGSTISNAYATGYVLGSYEVGGLVGRSENSTISNAYATGDVLVGEGGSYLGGLVGLNAGTINNAHANVNINFNGDNVYDVGGLAGYNSSIGTISNAYATGNISANGGGNIGGLIGGNSGSVSNVYAIGDVTANGGFSIGGLVGQNSEDATLSNAYAMGAVTGDRRVGGLVGKNQDNAAIRYTYSTGAVTGNTNVGGLVGLNEDFATINNNFWNSMTSNRSNGVGLINGGTVTSLVGKNTTQMQQLATFTDWDISNVGGDGKVWRIYEGQTSPLLRSLLTQVDLGTKTVAYNANLQFGNIAPSSLDENKVFGSAAAGTNTGNYVSSYYSNQQGYDFVGGGLVINPAVVSINATVAASAQDKVYDGNRNATVSLSSANFVSSDLSNLNINYLSALFDSANVVYNAGNVVNQNVTVNGISLSGSAASNYTLVNTQATASAKITPKDLTINANEFLSSSATVASVASTTALAGSETVAGLSLSGNTLSVNFSNGGLASNYNTTVIVTGASGTDLNVNRSLSWNGLNLSLLSDKNININSSLSALGSADKLSLVYGQGAVASSNTATYNVNAKVNLQAGDNFSTKLGSDGATTEYKVITALGAQGSSTGTDLQGINGNLGGNYVLGADIDATDTSGWNGGAGFNPLGSFSSTYRGKFDGLGHTVSNITINRPTTSLVGLFGYADGASITNLGLVGGEYTGSDYVGGLVGYNQSGTIKNVYSTANVTGNSIYVGGLVGRNESGSVIDAHTAGVVKGQSQYTGGLIGFSSSTTINNAYATGDVIGGSMHAGGLVGWQKGGLISNAYAAGAVSGSMFAGGLVGWQDGGLISNAYATGAVSGSIYVGGLVGRQESGTISNAYATGVVSGTQRYVGGLVGYQAGGTVSNAYATGAVNGASDFVGGLVGRQDFGAKISNAYAAGAVSGSMFAGGLVGWQDGGLISNAYATGAVSGTNNVGGLVGAQSSGTISNAYATGSVSGTNNVGSIFGAVGNGTITNSRAITATELKSLDFFKNTAGWDIDAQGGTDTIWRIYEGQTSPLLRSFLTQLNLTPDYDGSGNNLTNIGSVSAPAGADATQIKGTQTNNSLTLTSPNAGSYVATADITGLYSTQQGYDLIGATRTITTTGSAAGDIQLPNGISWTNGTLNINGNVNNPGAINSANGIFNLLGGTWSQVGNNNAAFSVKDFRITGGTFKRFVGGDGTSANPYQIADIYGLQGVGSAGMLDDNYVLANNIDASSATGWNDGELVSFAGGQYFYQPVKLGFNPIGNATTNFTGTFNGLGHTINNLYIYRIYTNDIGLFGVTNNASISNVGLENVSIRGYINTAGLVGTHLSGNISNSYVTGGISPRSGWLSSGGLVGYNAGTISDSYANVSVGSTGYAGTLVGTNSGLIERSHGSGAVYGYAIGGLVGVNTSTGVIRESYSDNTTMQSDGYTGVGGLVGVNAGLIENSYANNHDLLAFYGVTAGLVAVNSGTIRNSYSSSTIFSGVADFGNWGALVGRMDGGSIENSFFNSDLAQDSPYGVHGGTGITTAQMQSLSTFTNAGWDISNVGGDGKVWRIYEGQTGPLLRSFMTTLDLTGNNKTVTYNGTSQSVGNTLPNGTDANLVKGNVAGGVNAGTYVSQQYSTQQGYDIIESTLVIDPKKVTNLTALASAQNKVYDGTTTANAKVYSNDVITGDDVSFSYGAANFDTKDVDTGKTVTVTGIATGGTSAGNYELQNTTATTTADITAKSITVAATANNKVYDATTAATLSSLGSTGVIDGDEVNFSNIDAHFDSKDVGAFKSVTVNGITATGADANNYSINTTATTTADITAKSITVAATANNKVYDATTAATLSSLGSTGVIAGDEVNFNNTTANFDSKDAGTGKTVTVNGITATGVDANNYSINTTATTTADITPKVLNLSGSRMYDGTKTINANILSINGLVGTETLGLTGTGTVVSQNVGTNKTITPVNYTLTNGSNGGLASNYTLVGGTQVADITQKILTVSGCVQVNSKTYDGTTNAKASAGYLVLNGLVGKEKLDAKITGASFADKNAGNNKTVTVNYGLSNGKNGGLASNYMVVSSTATANINKANLFYVAKPVSIKKSTLSSSGLPALTGTLQGFVAGDNQSNATTGTLNWNTNATRSSNMGFYNILGSGLSSQNYNLIQAPTNYGAFKVTR